MGKPVKVLYKTKGLNTKDDPARLRKDELPEAVDVFVDRNGRVGRRTGYSLKTAGSFHSGWSNPNDNSGPGFVVGGTTLYTVGSEGIPVAAVSGLTLGAKMSYTVIGPKTYFMNGFEKGTIHKNGTAGNWAKADYVGPDTDRVYEDPPLGHLISSYNGRALVAVDRYLFHSELMAYGWFNLDDGYTVLDSRIRLIVPVTGGVFVSTDTKQHFFAGEDIATAHRKTVAGYPAHEGFFTYEDSGMLGTISEAGQELRLGGRVAIWSSSEGICLGTEDGNVVNVTRSRVVMPQAFEAAGTIHNNRLILLLKE